MKNLSIANLLVASIAATQVPLLLAAPNSLAAPAGTSFQCHPLVNHPSGSPWATFVVTSTGQKLGSPILLWKNQLGSTYTPEVRCKFVTNRLNIVVTNNGGKLSNLWLTVGRVNGQGVICYVNGVGGGCNASNVLLTLSGQNSRNPGAVLGDLLAYIQTGGASGTSIQESGGQLYVNLGQLVDAAVGTAPQGTTNPSTPLQPVPPPVTPQPVPGNQPSGGGVSI
ncbi:COP23 domain-containing protein [Coleofasciculus sp. F4-SAH-05]|uniref:COP23 domain-containing protein n=1 Tax=Coleofasciculus sp. F4-SAH-05 TaxID=3069525 RepID=UPI0032FE8386